MKFSLFISIILLFLTTDTFAQCTGNEPIVNLGNDTVLCNGNTLTLSAPSGYQFYNWTGGSHVNQITVADSGWYKVETGNIGANIVLNGNFQAGTTNTANSFTTQYIPGNGGAYGLLSNPSTYAITTSPNLVHTNFGACNDHSPGTGNMLVVNGATTGNTAVWQQTVTITPNTDYLFSFWQSSVEPTNNPSQLQLFINNVAISDPLVCNTTSCAWIENSGLWNSGTSTVANLKIVNLALAAGGNDFALDDVFFAPVCLAVDSIHIAFDTTTVNAGADIIFCANETGQLIGTSNLPGTTFSWSNNTIGATTNPLNSGTYTLTGVSTNGCISTDNVLVTIKSMNWNFDTIVMQPSDCGASNGFVYTLLDPSNPNDPAYAVPPQFQWSGPGANSTTTFNASSWDNLPVGWYYIQVNVNGCFRYDSIEVVPNNPPNAILSGSPLSGYAPLSVDFQNSSTGSSNFQWDFGNTNTTTTTDLSSQNQTYNTVGSYLVSLVATNGNCTDTAFLTVNVIPEPIIVPIDVIPYNVFSPNGDGANDVYYFDLINITKFEVVILNRWGNVVFQSSDLDAVWDGKTQEGELAKPGVYFYRYTATGIQNEALNGTGFVELVK
ncbi:MAG: gliding motility-associated C-terminal domain-containing protein [Crocinitomicaceae bacterium]|nr:gliding motility-associated C-terminal domain-containing protein [Crocinitomicaceae bacterium]